MTKILNLILLIIVALNCSQILSSCKKGDEEILARAIVLDKKAINISTGDHEILTVKYVPITTTNKELTWGSSNPAVATVSDGVVVALSQGKCEIIVTHHNLTDICTVNVLPSGIVDLGLSVYWSTCNLGASSPEDSGNYYSFGEVETKERFRKDSYKWYDPNQNIWTKYCLSDRSKWVGEGISDDKTILDSEDDAAFVLLGSRWRTPTRKEWEELISNCMWRIVDYNGITGYMATSKINLKSIFIPKSGYYTEQASLYSTKAGVYWSSTTGYQLWDAFVFSTTVSSLPYTYNTSKYYGIPIRPVMDPN